VKKIFITMLILASSLFASFEWDIDDAYDMAKKEKKSVMVMFSQKGCPACIYMKDVVLKNRAVIKAIKSDYVAVHIDIHEDFMPDGLEVFATPTFYFLNADGKVLERVNGYKNAKDFLEKLKNNK